MCKFFQYNRTCCVSKEFQFTGLRFEIAPHWHIYWRNPGDSGLAIRTQWSLPDDFAIIDTKWPIPDKIYEGPLANYGYEAEATLLQALHVPQDLPDGPLSIPLKVDVLVCKDICIPESASLTLRLNDPEHGQPDHGTALQAAREKLPLPVAGDFTFQRADSETQKIFALRLAFENAALFDAIAPGSAAFLAPGRMFN